MKKLILLALLFSIAAKADNQSPLIIEKTDSKYQNGDVVLFKLDKFYRKACRSPFIPGFETLKSDETIGIVDQFIEGTYRIVKVKCDSPTIYGWRHFDVKEKDIVKIYVSSKKKKKRKKSAVGIHSDYLP